MNFKGHNKSNLTLCNIQNLNNCLYDYIFAYLCITILPISIWNIYKNVKFLNIKMQLKNLIHSLNNAMQIMCLVLQSCPTLHPMDCSLPGSSVHGDSPGKNTGVGCHAPQGIFPTQGSNPGLLHIRRFFINWATREARHSDYCYEF